MTPADCLSVQRAVFEAGAASPAFDDRPDLAAHLEGCPDCRRWVRVFTEGMTDEGRATHLGDAIAEQARAAACVRARDLAGASFDGALGDLDRTLLAQHLDSCSGCRDVAAQMAVTVSMLPALADADPGPSFTARVLAATSRRQGAARFADRWRQAWASLADRPRFALEAAYGLTLVFVLVAGNPMDALERTAARVEPLAWHRVSGGVEDAAQAFGAGLGALRDRALGPEVQPAAETGWVAGFLDRFDRGVAAAFRGLSDLVATIESAVGRIRAWAGRVFGFGSAISEPSTAPVRSPGDAHGGQP